MASVIRRGNAWIASVVFYFFQAAQAAADRKERWLAASLAVSLPLSIAVISVVVKRHRLHTA
jgi:hypothetical protein